MRPTEGYQSYASELRALLAQGIAAERSLIAAHLDGTAAARLRTLVPLEARREIGAFFTPSDLRGRIPQLIRALAYRPPYLDPTCGAGDLLLAASETLPHETDSVARLGQWSRELWGTDAEGAFTEVSRLRLRLAVESLGGSGSNPSESLNGLCAFDKVRAGDGYTRLKTVAPFVGTILLNPPYGSIPADSTCTWSQGAIPRAGQFLIAAMDSMAPGSSLIAILPDVLRSGSRYRKWRALVGQSLQIEHIETLPQFDRYTDIHVFVIAGRRTEIGRGGGWNDQRSVDAPAVGDKFEIRTGSVVDNRDPRLGPYRSFATARTLPRGGDLAEFSLKRRFSGTVRQPPFVLVRRTSRPASGSRRAAGILVTAKEPVAVDNHLLIAIPKDGTIETCRSLIATLDSTRTDEFLDQRIRCRHLTVAALAEVPML